MSVIHITVPCILRVSGEEREFKFNMEIAEVPGDVEIVEVKQAKMEFIDNMAKVAEYCSNDVIATQAAYEKARQAEIDAGHISEDQ